MSRHLIVISEDAMVYEDLATLQTLPNFGRIWPQTARVSRTRSCYPSITYPAHTTLATGCYPNRHGIVNNERNTPCERSSPWVFEASAVREPSIFDAAKAKGLSTAAVFWPVTGHHPSIDYLINEYWPQTPGQSLRDSFAESGTSPEVMARIVDPIVARHKSRVHPSCDACVHEYAAAMIRAYQPNLLMIHPANIDAYRHHTGLFSPEVTRGLVEIDLWLGEILDACEDAGILADTDIFIVSDHGQMNIVRTLAPNVILRERGLIETDESGETITDYTAFVKSTALSAQVYLKNPGDRAAMQKTYELLQWMREEGVYGISRVYTAEEADREEHLAGDFSFVLESDGYTSFSNDWRRPLVRGLSIDDYRFGRATHGHHPDKGPQPTLLAFGPSIRAGAVAERRPLVDETATFARVLGLSMPGIDGTCIEEILK